MTVDVYPADKQTICLTMIVKDEAHIVRDALQSVLPHIAEYVIVDTGSTDETIHTIQRFFGAKGIPGRVFERPWNDFGSNRTEALQLARAHSDSGYLWMMDADDVVVGEPEFRGLTADGYQVRIGPTFEYWRTQIFKRTAPWRYVGVLHEYAACDTPHPSVGQVQGAYHIVSRRLGARNQDSRKYARDARVLEAALQVEPDNPRYVFYLAQSRYDAGEFAPALEQYRRRVSMGGWEQEVYYSRLRGAQCLERLNRPFAEVQAAYLECFRHHPSRAEPLVAAATRERVASNFATAYEYASQATMVPRPGADAMFVFADVYDYRALDEQAIAAFYIGRYEESFRINSELLERPGLPERERKRIEKNRDFSVPFIKDACLRYDAAIVYRILARPRSAQPQVTLSVTTCRRLDLFVKTITSFLTTCEDVELIDRWICVDDNSSNADRQEMQRLFPFFEFIWKGPEEKGHARSMNIIRQAVRTPFLVHLEDDWHFFVKRKYIEPAIEILTEAPDLGQVLFNRNYAEVLEQRDLPGGFRCFSWEHAYRYRIHEHYEPTSEEYRRFHQAHQWRSSCAYWPHYSLQPSVLKYKVFERVGPYDETAGHFELEYARRYVRAGMRSAFFDGIYCLHIGRLTSERGDASKPNAYELNQMVQFE